MDRIVLESLNKIRDIESQEVLTEATAAAAAPAAQAASKGIGRYIIPGVGAALGAQDAYSRYKKGDYAGAAISGVGAAASLIPGVGGLVGGLGSAGLNAMRDKERTGSYFPDEEEQAAAAAKDKAAQPAQATAPTPQVPPGGNPKVFALQQQLIAKGAKITADGKMGPQTQMAMKQFPDVKMAEDNEENKMSESQKIAELMSRLAQLEQAPAQPQVADEGIADLAKGAWQGIKNFGSAAKTGFTNPEYAKVAGVASRGANKGQVVNKVSSAGAKTGAALNTGAKVGAGAALAAGGIAATNAMTPATPDPTAGKPPAKPTTSGKPPAKPAAPAAGLTPQEEQELALLAADMAKLKGQNSELDALIDRHLKLRPDAGQIAQPQ